MPNFYNFESGKAQQKSFWTDSRENLNKGHSLTRKRIFPLEMHFSYTRFSCQLTPCGLHTTMSLVMQKSSCRNQMTVK